MDDVISKLTAEQALKAIERLARKGGEIQGAVATEVTADRGGMRIKPSVSSVRR